MSATDFSGIFPLSFLRKASVSLHSYAFATQAQIESLPSAPFPVASQPGLALSSSCCTSPLTELGQLQQGLSSSVQWTFARLTELFPSRPGASPANELASFGHCLAGCSAGWRLRLWIR